MAVSYDESKAGFDWPKPLDIDETVKFYEEKVDNALREGGRGGAAINRKDHPHVDTICVRLATDDPFGEFRQAVDVHRALEHRYLAAGWDYAKVDVGTPHQQPYLCLGRARQPMLVVPTLGNEFRVVPDEGDETGETTAARIGREGARRATRDGWVYIPPSQIREIKVPAIPEVERPIT